MSKNDSEADEIEKINHKDVVLEEENAESATDDHPIVVKQAIVQAEDIDGEEQDQNSENVEPSADQVCNF